MLLLKIIYSYQEALSVPGFPLTPAEAQSVYDSFSLSNWLQAKGEYDNGTFGPLLIGIENGEFSYVAKYLEPIYPQDLNTVRAFSEVGEEL